MLQYLAALAAAPLLPACSRADATPPPAPSGGASSIAPLRKSKAEWRKLLPSDAYEVLFEEDTEPPRSSPLNREKRPGTFVCAACYLPLFDAAHKFESGTGWPSFTEPIAGHVATKRDFKLILPRTEYHCARCGGHQGHVFKDGPPPRGERWCNNGLALRFVPKGDALPPLRT
ncbi:MAG: peptide-methionine (R)-S-oxide reductase MsrB [Myxococcales bacterium]|nr:peptide-methionine (R)-S-oxide reductase MsrB [Myxococcales bacterium]